MDTKSNAEDISNVAETLEARPLAAAQIQRLLGINTDRVLDALDALDGQGCIVVLEQRSARGRIIGHRYALKGKDGTK